MKMLLEDRSETQTAQVDLPTVQMANAVLAQVRRHFGLGPDVQLQWLGQSENTTFLVRYPNGSKAILRVGRRDYHSYEAVLAEITWMQRLRQSTDLTIPQALPGIDGHYVQRLKYPQSDADCLCVMFEFLSGVSPDNLNREDFIRQFQKLGEITAILHLDVLDWPESAALPRETWDIDDLVGPDARLGSWERSPHLGASDRSIINEALALARRRLTAYRQQPDCFGLIHSDLRCANLLIDGEQTALIDFDDTGFSYFMYDFGSAVTFIEDHPDIRLLLESWLRGYQRIRTLTAADRDEVKTFVLLRRIAIHGWIVSRWEADDVRNGLGINHDRVTVSLAARYLQACAAGDLIW